MSYYLDPKNLWLSPLPPEPPAPLSAPEVCANGPMPVDLWARTFLGFHADPVQAEILNTFTPRLAVCCSRQWGKTTIAAIKSLHFAWHNPGVLILFASRTFEQAAELLRHFREFAARLLGGPCKGVPRRPGSVLLPNGSRILALPQSPDAVRCYSAPAIIVVDDAAFVSTGTHNALSPMLASSNGQRWLLSTPSGQTGEFYEVWHATNPDWHKFSVAATDCPRISPAFLADERLLMGERVFRREYLCEFVPDSRTVIDRKLIDEAFCGDYPAMTFDH